jgi:hypothetical protein
MSSGWENHEPAPIEFMHGRLMDLFHEWRRGRTENMSVEIHGGEFNDLIAKAKTETYKKYAKLNLQEIIPKSKL